MYIEVIKICGSQPCFPSREQRYYGLIELKPKNSRSEVFQNSTVVLLGGLISLDLLTAVAHKLLDPQITLQQNGGRWSYFPGSNGSTQSRRRQTMKRYSRLFEMKIEQICIRPGFRLSQPAEKRQSNEKTGLATQNAGAETPMETIASR